MLNWIASNQEWVFSGIGATVLGGLIALFKSSRGETSKESATHTNTNSNTINIVNNVDSPQRSAPDEVGPVNSEDRIRRIKDSTRILFIDDDEKFKVVKILKTAGWSNTTIVKDIASLHDPLVASASIFFVDIQGVGVKLGFKDEGLGLAAALKEKYPEKRVVIYSAEPRGNDFTKPSVKLTLPLRRTLIHTSFSSWLMNMRVCREGQL